MIKRVVIAITVSIIFTCAFSDCNPDPGNDLIVHPISQVADTNVVLPPAWAFGVLYGAYTNQEQSIELVDQIIKHDYPIDAFWIDSWIWDWQNKGEGPKKYMDFIGDTVSYPNLHAMCDYMEERSIKCGMWMWDAIMLTGNEAAYEDFKSKGFFHSEYIRTDGWHNGLRTTIIGDSSKKVRGTWCGDIDFENQEATAYFQEKVKHFFDDGIDFIKLDKTDAIAICKAMFETTQKLGRESRGRGFIFSHSNGVDTEEYKKYPSKWADDTRSDWNVEDPNHEFSPWIPKVAFKEVLAMFTDTSRHYSSIPFLANDIGGFALPVDGSIDDELYIRWLQFAVFEPLTTLFSQPENPTQNIAFKISDQADSIFRDLTHIKMELFPYLYSYAHLVRLEGKNIIRPERIYEYKYGDEIYVAPVYVQGARTRKLILPEGDNWISYWDGKLYEGGQTIEVEAPIEQIPLFLRQGAIIPMREYAQSIEMGSNDMLELHIYDGAPGDFTLIEDDGISNDYLNGVYAKTILSFKSGGSKSSLTINPVIGHYQDMPLRRQWKIVFHTEKELKHIQIGKQKLEFVRKGSLYYVEIFEAAKSEIQRIEIVY